MAVELNLPHLKSSTLPLPVSPFSYLTSTNYLTLKILQTEHLFGPVSYGAYRLDKILSPE